MTSAKTVNTPAKIDNPYYKAKKASAKIDRASCKKE